LQAKGGMSVLTKGLAMGFVTQGRKNMVVTRMWPASVNELSSISQVLPMSWQSIQSAATNKNLEFSSKGELKKQGS
jgi:hypothetical protein